MPVEIGHTDPCACDNDVPEAPRFCVNTEGTEHWWGEPTITTEQLAQLGGWDTALGVIQINEDNTERTLAPGETVHLEPGHAFCRRVRWKRGLVRTDRITREIELLRRVFPNLEFRDDWVRIAGFSLPVGWNRSQSDIAFQIINTFPGAPPYGIYVPVGLRFNDKKPDNYTEPASVTPPFAGSWGVFSWSVMDEKDWRPTADVERGVNLLQWVRGFAQRFAEGV